MIVQTESIDVTSTFMLDDLLVDAKRNSITRGSTFFPIEPRLMRVIVRLAQEAGEVVNRNELLNEISEHPYVTDESLTQAISKIRNVMGDTSRQPKFIKTIPRKGYVLLVMPKLAPAATAETGKQRISFSEKRKNQLIILLLVAFATVTLIAWRAGDTEFVEQGEIEFIEKEK